MTWFFKGKFWLAEFWASVFWGGGQQEPDSGWSVNAQSPVFIAQRQSPVFTVKENSSVFVPQKGGH